MFVYVWRSLSQVKGERSMVKKHFSRKIHFRAPDARKALFRVKKRVFENFRLLRGPLGGGGGVRVQKHIRFSNFRAEDQEKMIYRDCKESFFVVTRILKSETRNEKPIIRV